MPRTGFHIGDGPGEVEIGQRGFFRGTGFLGIGIDPGLDGHFQVIQDFTGFPLLFMGNGFEFFKQPGKDPFTALVMNPE